MAFTAYGGSSLIWSLANNPRVPATLSELLAMPARVLWQCETMARAYKRVDEKAEFLAAGEAAHKAAVAKARR